MLSKNQRDLVAKAIRKVEGGLAKYSDIYKDTPYKVLSSFSDEDLLDTALRTLAQVAKVQARLLKHTAENEDYETAKIMIELNKRAKELRHKYLKAYNFN